MKKVLFMFLATPLFFVACKNERTASRNYGAELISAGVTSEFQQQQLLAAQQREKAVQSERIVYVNSSSNEARVTKKKGMSKAAKGAIIGGTAGAVTVGLITKSGKGAVVGGILGAGTGYIIGRKQDKKDGRVQ